MIGFFCSLAQRRQAAGQSTPRQSRQAASHVEQGSAHQRLQENVTSKTWRTIDDPEEWRVSG
jgi:hypothetical protein